MAQFRFTYEVVETWTGYFDAENEAEAQKLYDEMVKNDENPEEFLPNYSERNFDIARNHEVLVESKGNFGIEKLSE